MKKIVIINLDGPEGAGKTRHTEEIRKWFTNCTTDYICKVFGQEHQTMTRKRDAERDGRRWLGKKLIVSDLPWGYVDFSSEEDMTRVTDVCNNADIIIYVGSSVAKPGDERKEKAINNVLQMLKEFNGRIFQIFLQVAHNASAIRRECRYAEFCMFSDLVLTHSEHGDIAKLLEKSNIKTPIKAVAPAADETDIQYIAANTETERDIKRIGFIGRALKMKGIENFYRLQKAVYKEDNEFLCYTQGLTLFLGALQFLYKEGKRSNGLRDGIYETNNGYIEHSRSLSEYAEDIRHNGLNKNTIVFTGYYNREKAIANMANNGFGCSFYHLERPEQYGYSMEYAMQEIVFSNTIPIFHRHFGENCLNITTEEPHCKKEETMKEAFVRTGTIFVDDTEESYKEAAKLITHLAKAENLEEYYTGLQVSFNYWKKCYNRNLIFTDMKNKIEDAVKQY